MNKQEFEQDLRSRITSLPEAEIEKSVAYYMELLEDHIEDGASEGEAIAALGTMNEIVEGIYYDQSLPTLVKAKVKEKKKDSSNNVLLIILTILGFPIWFPILGAILSVIISFYTTIWSLIAALYFVVLAFGLGGIILFFFSIFAMFVQSPVQGLVEMGISLCMIAVAMFLVYPVFWISKGLVKLTGWVLRKIKSAFIKKNEEEEQNEENL